MDSKHWSFMARWALIGAALASIAWTALGVFEVWSKPTPVPVTPHAPTATLLHERADYQVRPPDILAVTVPADLVNETDLKDVNGNHLVDADGTIDLGIRLGRVFVDGKTRQEIAEAIEERLSASGGTGTARVRVVANNSRVFYVINQATTAQQGDTVARMPCLTGSERVSQALAQLSPDGIGPDKAIWIARPKPGNQPDSVLQVDWTAVSHGDSRTDHQLTPGDRVFVAQRSLLDIFVEKAFLMLVSLRSQFVD